MLRLNPNVDPSLYQDPYNLPGTAVTSGRGLVLDSDPSRGGLETIPGGRTQSGGTPSNVVNNGVVGGASSTGGSGGATGDADTAAFYDDQARQLQGQLGQLDPQLQVGLGNIGNSYNLRVNRLNEQRGVADRDYGLAVDNNTQNYLQTRGGINTNVRNTNNALQRLLGLSGSGFSSAAFDLAPYASALQGSQALSGAQDTFANNLAVLDTNKEDTERSYNNSVEDLDNQRFGLENQLRSSIAQTRAGLLDKIASAGVNANLARGENYQQAIAARSPYESQISSLLEQITQLGNQFQNPVLQAGDVNFQAPDLGQYSLGPQTGIDPGGGAQSNVNPAFLNVLAQGQDRDEFGNLVVR